MKARHLVFFMMFVFSSCTPKMETTVSPTPGPVTRPSTTPPPATVTAVPRPTAVPLTLDGFVTELTEIGLRAAIGETFPGHIFSVPIQTLQVNGQSVLVYKYPDAETAVTEAGWIKSGGTEFSYPDPDNPDQMIATIVEPTGTPHYFRLENLLVNYNGDDLDILAGLSQVLGPQIIGGPIPEATTAVPSP